MKKQKHQIGFLLIVAIYFIFNSCTTEPMESTNEFQLYIIEMQEEGYSKEAAEHIAKVDYLIIPIDDYYEALIED